MKRLLPGPWTLLFIIAIALFIATMIGAIFFYQNHHIQPYRISNHPAYIAPTDDE